MLEWKNKVLNGLKGLLGNSVKQLAGSLDAGETVVMHKLIEANKLDELLTTYDIFKKASDKKEALKDVEQQGSWICQYSQIQLWSGLKDDQRELLFEILKDEKAKKLFVKSVSDLYTGYVYHA